MKRNGKQPTTLDELRAQRDALAQRLAAAERAAHDLDPLNDWERLSALATEAQALERAISTADERIAGAQLVERDTAAAERDAERAARAVAARANLDAAARAVLDALAALPLAELDAAHRELGACGGWPSPAASHVLPVVNYVDSVKLNVRMVAPTWLGLAEPLPKHAQALAEARADLERAKDRLAAGKKLQNAQRNDAQGQTITTERMAELAAGVDICQRRLAELA